MKRRTAFRFAFFSALLMLSACAGDSWVGEDGKSALTGKRLSILNYGTDLTPDADSLKKIILLPAPETVESWKQAGGLPHHAMQNPALPPKIIQAWQADIGEGSRSDNLLIAEPVGENGVIYTIDARALVRAFAVSSGKRLWETPLFKNGSGGVKVLGSGLALDNGMLFAATGTGDVAALDAKNGREIWRIRLPSPVRSAPAVYGGRLFVLTADNKLVALAEDDGRILWQHYAFLESVSLLGKAAPALDKGIGVAVFASGEVLGFRPENGSILWTEALGAARTNDAAAEINDIRARPVISDDKVFVITSGGLLSALDLKSGAAVWEREIEGINQPWLAGETLYVVSAHAELVALEAATGKILWINRLARWEDPENKKGRLFWTGPILAGNRLILTNSAGKAVAVAPQTGTIIGWEDIDDVGTLPPIVLNDILFFITHNAKLVAYR